MHENLRKKTLATHVATVTMKRVKKVVGSFVLQRRTNRSATAAGQKQMESKGKVTAPASEWRRLALRTKATALGGPRCVSKGAPCPPAIYSVADRPDAAVCAAVASAFAIGA